MTLRLLIIPALLLAGCATAGQGGKSRYSAEFEATAAACRERGGILTPVGGARSGRPAIDYACQITGNARVR